MTEGYLKYYLSNKLPDLQFEVYSAGIETHGLNPLAVTVMNEDDIDISQNSSDLINKYIDYDFHYVITVCDNASEHCPIFPGETIRIHWQFDDPAKAHGSEEEIMYEFRRVRDEIKLTVMKWVDCL